MATSPNYAWAEPDNSSLVKNGASDIRTLGDAIDTSVWNVGFGQAGKNKIINGNFGVNQRSFTTTTAENWLFDRFYARITGDGTATVSAQTFTPGAAPVAGYESTNYVRFVTSGQTSTAVRTTLRQTIEDVRTFAGQPVTVSFWAKAATGTPKVALLLSQGFGTGGSASVDTAVGSVTISTSWARYSLTVTLPSITGKTIGAGNRVLMDLAISAGSDFNTPYSSIGIQNNTFDFWGVQAEYGSKATPFQTASGGSPQAELAMCQRYYYRQTPSTSYGWVGYGLASGSTGGAIGTTFPVQMRTTPSAVEYSTLSVSDASSATAVTSLTLDTSVTSAYVGVCNFGVASGLTAYRPYYLRQNASASGYLAYTAEL